MNYKDNVKPVIAFIESNTTGTGEKFVSSAIQNGFDIIFIAANSQKYKFLRKLLIHPVLIDTRDIEKIYNYLKNIKNLKAIISTSENFVYSASIVAKRLDLIAPEPESIAKCRNKFIFANCLKTISISTAQTILIKSLEEASINLHKFKLPVIVKPNIGTGSVGVKLCYTEQEILIHLGKLLKSNTDALVQEYILGTEFSVEVIALNKKYHFLGITKKYLGKKPYFVEISHDFPALINKRTKQKIRLVVSKALKSIGLDYGPIHIELKVVNDEIYIIEINPRLAGGMIPILIENAHGINLIDNLIKLYVGQDIDFTPTKSIYTKIAFILPKNEGILKNVTGLQELTGRDIIDAYMYKEQGEFITIKGDFSDRLGFVITKGKTPHECKKILQKAIDTINFSVDQNDSVITNYSRGRLASALDPRVKSILTRSAFANLDNLKLISKINKAHITMLEKCNIISQEQLTILWNSIEKLELEDFKSIRENANNPEKGYYLAYEEYLVDEIGIEIAGKIHAGRSRNDINATIQRLKSREIFYSLYSAIWNLRSTILHVADRSREIEMPMYSQYQPAMPANYSYYLLAIENSLAQHVHSLQHLIPTLNTSLLGACSGAGTTFSINPKITSELLGFKNIFNNALNVVATRDAELTLLAISAIIGTTISRIAQDFQLWTTNEFRFFELPDRLCGISSTMPQKKNPYLLEKIKGKAISISSEFNFALSTIQKTSFTNSVEVGTEAFINYQEKFEELIRAIKLLELIIEGAEPVEKNMSRSNLQGLTIATIFAESLTKTKNISFREAHDIIGKTIVQAIDKGNSPLDALFALDSNFKTLMNKKHYLLEYGCGPGRKSESKMFKRAVNILKNDSVVYRDFNITV